MIIWCTGNPIVSRLRGATVARLTPDQKVACSNHVGVIIFCYFDTLIYFIQLLIAFKGKAYIAFVDFFSLIKEHMYHERCIFLTMALALA